MNKLITFALITVAAVSARAQNLTPAQKESDFRYLASLYTVYYAPLEWKKQLFGFDALDIKPWLDRAAKTATDLDFYEVCVEYIASLNDTHVPFSIPSDFVARLGFTVDIYDGVLLIDNLDRTALPLRDYPFVIGDELISVDGVNVEQLLKDFVKYSPQGNPRSARRLAAQRITTRAQSRMPHANSVGEKANVVIKRQNGNMETYSIPWVKTGTPIEVGPVSSPATARVKSRVVSSNREPEYMKALTELQFSGVIEPTDLGVNNYGSRNPIYLGSLGPATNFTRRLGGLASDFFYSGIFKRDELTFGYIRIPNYSPPSQPLALQQLDSEIAYMNVNTDGLIVDDMRNTGGLLCFGENVMTRLVPYKFRATGFALRAYWSRILGFYNALVAAKNNNSPPEVILQYEIIYNAMVAANKESRGLTDSLPLCTSSLMRDPFMDRDGTVLAYKKPIMMLIDEFSTSTADSVPGMFKDAGRGLLFGMRTNGAGGNNISLDAGAYSEAVTGMTLALQTRKSSIEATGYPSTIFIENAGVQPDFVDDYMTKDNLLRNGAQFVADVLEAMAAYTREHR